MKIKLVSLPYAFVKMFLTEAKVSPILFICGFETPVLSAQSFHLLVAECTCSMISRAFGFLISPTAASLNK